MPGGSLWHLSEQTQHVQLAKSTNGVRLSRDNGTSRRGLNNIPVLLGIFNNHVRLGDHVEQSRVDGLHGRLGVVARVVMVHEVVILVACRITKLVPEISQRFNIRHR